MEGPAQYGLHVWTAIIVGQVAHGAELMGAAPLALLFTGVLTIQKPLAGFGDPTVPFIAALFVVSEALDATGITAWAGQKVIARAGTKRRRLLVVISLLVAGLTALISVNGAVAALLPLVVVVAARSGIATSKLSVNCSITAKRCLLRTLSNQP